jgi:Cdc6-like AAA superfamily ATPase
MVLISSGINNMQARFESIYTGQYRNDVMKWLAPPDVSSNLNKAIKARHPGSGRRLLESKAYTMWKKGGNSFLWLNGIPGCGKTILASTVIEDLQRSQSQSRSQMLLYFYFDFTDSRMQSFENTIRSLVCQIYHQNESAQKHLDSLYSSVCRNKKEQPSFDSLQKTFTEMIGSLKEVWIVLDALDECTPRNELLSWINSVAQDSFVQVNIHLLVTSRPEQDIKGAILRYASDEQMIAIQDDLLEADIRNYVQARVREHEGLSRWRGNKEIQDQIEASLVDKADGM